MADKLEFCAVAPKTCIGVPFISGDTLHFGLRHCRIIVILAVRAATTTSLFFVALHGLAHCDPIWLIGRWFVAGILWAEHPIINGNLGILFVLGCGDEFFAHRQAHKALGHHHKFVHAVFPYVISRPDARIVSEVAALAMVEINPPLSKAWPTNSGIV